MPTRGECPLSDRPEGERDPRAGPLRRGERDWTPVDMGMMRVVEAYD